MMYLAATVFPAPLSPLRKEGQKYPPVKWLMTSSLSSEKTPSKQNPKQKETGRKEFSKKCTILVEKVKSQQDQVTSLTCMITINMVCGPVF